MMGRQPGIYEVASQTAETLTLQDVLGLFQVPVAATQPFDDAAARLPAAPASVEPPPPRFEVDEFTEATARGFYDNYCAAVGGKAFNGDPLPPASEFFEDPAKTKQANAYRVAMGMLRDNVQIRDDHDKQSGEPLSDPLPEDMAPSPEDTPAPDEDAPANEEE